MPQMVAEASYSELLDPKDGFFRNCRIDLEGLAVFAQPSRKPMAATQRLEEVLRLELL